MVDSFFGIDGGDSVSGFTVPSAGMFCRDGVLDECALIENMAQSAALRIGYLHISQGKPVPLGFIGAVSDFEVLKPVYAGDALRTRISVKADIMGTTLAEAEVTVGGERVCGCRLKIFIRQEENEEETK